MPNNPTLSPNPVNNEGQPHEWDIDTVRRRLRDSSDWTRWAAAREVYFRKDAQSRDTLVDLLQNDPYMLVRRMASQALGALYDAGVEIPLYAQLHDDSPEVRKELIVARLKELGVEVRWDSDEYYESYKVYVPFQLEPTQYMEIGCLMGQLVEVPFPQHYAPIADTIPSLVLPDVPSHTIHERDSTPSGMRFSVFPKGAIRKT